MKIGIVNDLTLAVEALRRALATEPAHEVAWVAQTGEEAVTLCARETPDVVLMDLAMPGMGGVEATRVIMRETPCPILIATGNLGDNGGKVFEAMGHGAIDVVEVPALDALGHPNAAPLLAKLDTIRRLTKDDAARSRSTRVPSPGVARLIAIGASAGGPAALARLLGGLPVTLPACIVIVQHVDAQFASGMAEWLSQQSEWPVVLASEGHRPQRSTALLAGTGDHLVFKAGERLGYTADPVDYAYRPSIDVFFHSLVREWRGPALGVLLTGMGRDGALGLKAMREKGHHTIAQDEVTSAVYGMPKAAAKLDAAVDILALGQIAPRLQSLVADKSRGSHD